jgi:ABC-type nitrate/sulfonate/bicarbonate transport system ATPase subunit
LLVTHSPDEAAVMAEKVVFLNKDGKIAPLENHTFQIYAEKLNEEDKKHLDNPGELLLLPEFNDYKKKIREEYEKNCKMD